MAAFFLVLAVVTGVVLGDAVLANTGDSTVTLFDRNITGFTQGQLLVIAAGLGFLFALFLFLAWGSSTNRRAKRRELRLVQRDMAGRINDLERTNAGLRDQVERGRRSRLGEADSPETTRVSSPALPRRDGDRVEEHERASN